MILRNVAIRHGRPIFYLLHLGISIDLLPGRKALAAPLRKSSLRCLTTETLTHEAEAIEHSINNHSKETHSIEANLNQLHINKKFVSPASRKMNNAEPSVKELHRLQKKIKRTTSPLGSVLTPEYKPHEMVLSPKKPEDVTLELLMASQTHLGHSTSLWNPANQRYIFGVRQGVHIISLEETAAHLRRAAKVVEGVAYHGGLILFVGTRPGQASAVVKAAQLAKGCHLFDRWTPGSITNGDQILSRCRVQAVDKDDKRVHGFEEKIAEWKALKPDLVVVLNPLENYILLHECGLNNIPTIGVIDTDADPTWVTYPIPANDDRFVSPTSTFQLPFRSLPLEKYLRLNTGTVSVAFNSSPASSAALAKKDKGNVSQPQPKMRSLGFLLQALELPWVQMESLECHGRSRILGIWKRRVKCRSRRAAHGGRLVLIRMMWGMICRLYHRERDRGLYFMHVQADKCINVRKFTDAVSMLV